MRASASFPSSMRVKLCVRSQIDWRNRPALAVPRLGHIQLDMDSMAFSQLFPSSPSSPSKLVPERKKKIIDVYMVFGEVLPTAFRCRQTRGEKWNGKAAINKHEKWRLFGNFHAAFPPTNSAGNLKTFTFSRWTRDERNRLKCWQTFAFIMFRAFTKNKNAR